jgi:hypothetical protein
LNGVGLGFSEEKMKHIIFLVMIFWAVTSSGQKIELKAANWDFPQGLAEFGDSAGMARMKVLPGRGFVVLKGVDFSDGTIEFDEIPTDPSFAQVYFRWQDNNEAECFYFRTRRGAGNPYAMEAVQYTPIIKGTMCWDAMAHYQTNAVFTQTTVSHVKLVISGRQMRVYVSPGVSAEGSAGAGLARPVLEVPALEGNTTHGTLAFAGQAIISNLVLKPGKVEGLSPVAGPDPVANDPRYLRHWMVTAPDSLPKGIDFSYALVPGAATSWEPIDAERLGLINLSRRYAAQRSHRIVWLKTTIHADQARNVQLRLGFLDEVWMYLNDKLLYVDKNLFAQGIAKVPNGRLSLENSTVTLPLQQGDNVLRIAVGNNFYTWAIMARLDDLEGLTIERTADGR